MKFAIAELPHTVPSSGDSFSAENAAYWASREAHIQLHDELHTRFDGWAVTVREQDVTRWLSFDGGLRTASWVRKRRKRPNGRATKALDVLVMSTPLPALYGVPETLSTAHVLSPDFPTRPAVWFQWAAAHLGVRPGVDDVIDFFTEDRVSAVDEMLPLEAS